VRNAKFFLEGGEGRQAQGDVQVGVCRLPVAETSPGTEAVPTQSFP
jgi:hypothetical protein